jgi:tetratricopeptide (TPR) repeat protein
MLETYEPLDDPDGEIAELLDELLNEDTRSLYAENVLAKAEMQLEVGALDTAEDSVNEVLAMFPMHAKAYTLRGIIAANRSEYGVAMDDFARAIQFEPDFPHVYIARGESNRRVGQLDKAMRDFNVAIRIAPRYAEAYLRRGITRGQMGDVPGAASDFSRFIELDPGNPAGYQNRAIAHLRLGDKPASDADLAKANALRAALEPGDGNSQAAPEPNAEPAAAGTDAPKPD